MQRTIITGNRLLATIALVIAVSAGVATAQVKKGKSRSLQTGQWMRGVVKPHCEAIKKGLETAPADDKAWQALAVNAAVLNETSFILMDDGRCPDGVWANATTKTLRLGTSDLLAAIEKKDATEAKAAFGRLAASCKECHEKHKEK